MANKSTLFTLYDICRQTRLILSDVRTVAPLATHGCLVLYIYYPRQHIVRLVLEDALQITFFPISLFVPLSHAPPRFKSSLSTVSVDSIRGALDPFL